MLTKRQFLTGAMIGAALMAGPAAAQYPERDITMIVAYSAGGGTDVMARTMVPFLEKHLGGTVTITVDNRPGAGGERGFTALAQAEPDGYTLGMLNIPAFITPIIQREPAYTIDSFAALGNVVSDPASIVVRADSDFQTLEDFIAYVRENPGVMPVGNSAIGGAQHTSLLRFLTANDLQVTHVPFPGSAPSRTAVLGGHVAAAVMGLGEAAPLHDEGQLRILATMAANTRPEAPEVPTFRELGYNIVSGSDRGMGAPAGVPEEILAIMAEAVRKTVEDPEFLAEAMKQQLPINYMPPEEHAAHMRSTFDEMMQIWQTTPWAN
jgi:tripartite-type tricarboxylate transporter receptor subunit TctC